MSQERTRRRHEVPARRVEHAFDSETIPKHWLAGNKFATHVSNGVNVLFPQGERFFVRSVKRFEETIKDPELREQVRGFYAQEGRHAREHERYLDVMREQGFELGPFLTAFGKAIRFFEDRLPPELGLATTAAAEHFTAIMAASAFGSGDLELAHPVMRDLLKWHAAEEIEHKSVAFDVLMEVDPRYRVRVAGLLFATVFLAAWWTFGAFTLMRQDGVTWASAARDLAAMQELRKEQDLYEPSIGRDVFGAGIRAYLKRDFHPWDVDDLHLAADYLETRDDAVVKSKRAA